MATVVQISVHGQEKSAQVAQEKQIQRNEAQQRWSWVSLYPAAQLFAQEPQGNPNNNKTKNRCGNPL